MQVCRSAQRLRVYAHTAIVFSLIHNVALYYRSPGVTEQTDLQTLNGSVLSVGLVGSALRERVNV